MRLYRIISPARIAWAGTEADARKVRAGFIEAQGLKRKDTDVELTEVPTSKPELLKFLNDREAGK